MEQAVLGKAGVDVQLCGVGMILGSVQAVTEQRMRGRLTPLVLSKLPS